MRSLGTALVFGIVLLSGVVRAQDKTAPAKEKDFDVPKTYSLDLQVVDKTSGEAIPGLTLSAWVDDQRRAYSTDENGHASIDYPAAVKYLSLSARPAGFVPAAYSWNGTGKKDHLPDTVKLELEHGTRIGGMVTDEAGKPVAGVDVEILFQIKNDPRPERTNFYERASAKTDANGKWRNDTIPADVANLSVRLDHPDFLTDSLYGERLPLAKLRDLSAVIVMKKGITVAGRVIDAQGKAIAGAQVALGQTLYGRRSPQGKSDQDGRFSLTHCQPGRSTLLIVTAKGHSPEVKPFVSDKDVNDVEVKLEPGHVLRVQVVDPAGNPLAGAGIQAKYWRGEEVLNWRVMTDRDGRAVWNEAPAEVVAYGVWQKGYIQLVQKSLTATGEEQVITLLPELKISGTVTDAETGKPIARFGVVRGWASNRGGGRIDPFWDRNDRGVRGEGGTFEYTEDVERDGYAVRIEADGYLPAESRTIKPDEGNVSLEFKLKKGKPLAGTLRAPDGKPLAGADVLVVSGSSQIYITNGAVAPGTYTLRTKADDAGRFSLPAQIGKFSLLVVHDAGYAELSPEELPEAGVISAKPWGRVEGAVWVGAKPGAGLEISAMPNRVPAMTINYQTLANADDKGRFVLERVLPGKADVAIQMTLRARLGSSSISWTQRQHIDVQGGKTVEATIGGKGRAVIGLIVPPAELAADIDWYAVETSISSKITAARKLPADWATLGAEAKRKLNEEWSKSPEAREAQRQFENRLYFPVRVETGGAIRVDDVPAGIYELTIYLRNTPDGGTRALGGAQTHVEFTIPEMPSGRSDEPLDLGKVELKAVKRDPTGGPPR